ncbi:MAG TPA: hypothetical protein VM344_10425 [Vitreimonas sp.]|nr:hypothetical protein [Vitreimonas sp.]
MRLRSVTTVLAALLLVVACGGTNAPGTASPPVGGSPTAGSTGPSVFPLVVSREFGVGRNRGLFAFIDAATNRQVADPERTVTVEFTGPGGETAGPVEGTFIWAIENERAVYATEVDFPVAGAWTAVFRTAAPDAPEEAIEFGFDVKEDTSVLRDGEPAPPVDTPTADDVGGDLARLSTDEDPVADFYRTSVADALSAGEPFVLAFATPKFCATAQCGPTLDRLKPIAADHPDVTFINVEPYELEVADGQLQPVLNADGQLQPVAAVGAFGLLTEPYLFVVDSDGIIRASFEAIFSEEEIEAALAELG